jgi:uncharacterized protein YdbL (DUF1318 family)
MTSNVSLHTTRLPFKPAWAVLSAGLLPLLLLACVTINVYFPAAEAARAADLFIQDVYGKQTTDEEAKPPAPKAPGGQSLLETRTRKILAWSLDFIVPPAHAQANIDLSSPAIQQIKRSMQDRQRALQPFYSSGAIGMTADGLIDLRDPSAVPLKDRNLLRKLVADENRDRNALYREVAQANGHPEWEPNVRSTFAERWVANAPSGWWYQAGGGRWQRK